MNRTSRYSQQGRIHLDDEKPNAPKQKVSPVPKATLEEGILQLLASAAEMQQRQDLDSAHQLYQAAMEKVKEHGLNRKTLFTGTNKKPPPLNSRTPIEWCLHVGDMASAICLLDGPNAALAKLRSQVSFERIEQILDAGADVEHRMGPLGRTLLLHEAAEGRYPGVRLALDRGGSITCMDNNGDTALALALRSQESQANLVVEELLQAHAELNIHDGQGQPLFKVALTHAQPEVVTHVIRALAPLTAQHRQYMEDWTACLPQRTVKWSKRAADILSILLNHGLDPNTRCQPTGITLLEIAIQLETADSEGLVAELLEKGADPMLEVALRCGTPRTIAITLERLKPLVAEHYQLMVSWVNNSTLSSWRHGRESKILEMLLDHGLDPNLRLAKAPHSPLIVFVAKYGDITLLQRLIAYGALLDVANDDSDTALICAAKGRNRQIYDALKAAGVNDKLFLGWTIWSQHAKG